MNLKIYQNFIIGLKVTAILLNGLIFPIGRVASGRVCAQPAKQACLKRLTSKKYIYQAFMFLCALVLMVLACWPFGEFQLLQPPRESEKVNSKCG